MTRPLYEMDPARLVFVGGLHRSGTTALGRILGDHPEISGFHNTGAEEDEGQHLQQSYAPAIAHGGPGKFARASGAHLTQTPGPPELTRADLLRAWTPFWQLDRRLLIEKSPPNMIMGRYLQCAFPGSSLIVILRHPVIVALSTKKWAKRQSLARLVEHWLVAHDLLRRDSAELNRLHLVYYEHLVSDPVPTLAGVADFLGLETPLGTDRVQTTRSSSYVDRWNSMESGSALERRHRARIIRQYSERVAAYGYDISRPSDVPATTLTLP